MNANEKIVFDVYFTDYDISKDCMLVRERHPTGACVLRVAYDMQPDIRSKELNIWSGLLVPSP